MFIRPDLAMTLAGVCLWGATATAAVPGAGGRCGASYAQATAARAAADAAGRKGDQRAAAARLDDGLRALGSRYFTREMIDDSGMHLLLARKAEADGRMRQAVAIKREVLSNRLQLCLMR